MQTGILLPEDWQDCHLMVTDAAGQSVVIESRNSVISVIPSDICTNFYLGSDDMENYYRNGKLREEAVKMTDENNSAALVILQSAVQNPYTNASGISMTQYSAIYNNEKKTVEVWPFQNYSKSFVFDVTGNPVSAE